MAIPRISGFSTWHFDINQYIDPYIPPPPWKHLPYPISYVLGYRRNQPVQLGNIAIIFWAFIGIMCGVSIIAAVSEHVPLFQDNGAPIIVGSFGAAAVLEFYSIESPLAQPRNAVLSQIIASVIGVSIAKVFSLSSHFDRLRWLAGALSCATATSVMALTGTVHPPAGATALLAVVDDASIMLGWYLIPVMLLGCTLMMSTALIINNIQRHFPLYWWTPDRLEKSVEEDVSDTESKFVPSLRQLEGGVDTELILRRGSVHPPKHLQLSDEEVRLLERISYRL